MSSVYADPASDISSQEKELEVVREKLAKAKQDGNLRMQRILEGQVSLREEQLERARAAFRANHETTVVPTSRSNPPPFHPGERVISQSGAEGRFLRMEGERVIFEMDDGRIADTSIHRVNREVPSTTILMRDSQGQTVYRSVQKGTELRYISDLWGVGGASERELFPAGKVERVFSDGRIRLTNGNLINKLAIKSVFYAIPFLGGIKAVLSAGDYILSATPAHASTLGAPYMSEEGLDEFLKLPTERQKEILELDGKFAEFLNSLFEGVVKKSGGLPKNIQCTDGEVRFDLEPSSIPHSGPRTVQLKRSSSGQIRSAHIVEKWTDKEAKFDFEFNSQGDVTRVHPEVQTLRGGMAKEVNRPMDMKSYHKVASGFADGVGIANVINQTAAFPAYLRLVSSDLESKCAADSSGSSTKDVKSSSSVGDATR